MKKFKNGVEIEIPAEEIKQVEQDRKYLEAAEKSRPFSEQEAASFVLKKQIQTISVTDAEAHKLKDFYPTWEKVVGQKVGADFIFVCEGNLFRTIKKQILYDHYKPINGGVGLESLYSIVPDPETGTQENPTFYSGNMELIAGKYYYQAGGEDHRLYRCNRNTEIPVYNQLAELVGLYVEVVE